MLNITAEIGVASITRFTVAVGRVAQYIAVSIDTTGAGTGIHTLEADTGTV